MLSFTQYLITEEASRYVYHGTSSNHIDSIKKEGLKPSIGKGDRSVKKTYVTRDPHIAALEAHCTTYGDPATGTKGHGGDPVVLKIDRLHPKFRDKKRKFKVDRAWHGTPKQRKIHNVHSFHRKSTIHPDAIVSVHHAVAANDYGEKGLGSEYKHGSHKECYCSHCDN